MIRTLDLPWGVSHPAVQYWKDKKVHVYRGAMLPDSLQDYASQDFSYHRWIEDELNGMVLPPEKHNVKFTPRDHQIQAAKSILLAYKRGDRGFIEADKTGLGKTLSTLSGVCAIAKNEKFNTNKKAKLLVVCPKGVIPVWRQTLHSYPISSALLRVMVINYQQLNKLLTTPSQAKVAKKTRTKNVQTARNGKPKIDWDYIIFDEAQYLKNYPKSTASLSASSVARLNEPYAKSKTPFVIYSTATPGSTPLNLACMSGILAPLLYNSESSKKITPNTWPSFLEKIGFSIKKSKKGEYRWIQPPWGSKNDTPSERRKAKAEEARVKKLQRADSQRIGKALLKANAPFIMRSPSDIAGWPEQQLIPYPLELTSRQWPMYRAAWSRFRDWLRMPGSRNDPKGALVEMLRYRQKTSLLKVEPLQEFIEDSVESGKQVYISCEFLETVDAYIEFLEKKKIPYAELTGRRSDIRTEERLRFQKGEAKVVLCNIVEGISLHANEALPDGSKASSNPRVTIIHDVRQNDLNTDQSLGRAHRDGENSLIYFPYFSKTIDEKSIARYVNKRSNMKSMLGSDIDEAEDLEQLFFRKAAEDQ